jgi:hypothetical protein
MITTDHNKIREWVEERDGRPAIVAATQNGTGGLLRIDFGDRDEELEEVSWIEFFKIFDDNNLAFLYQEEAASGGLSRFFKFIDRNSVNEDEIEELPLEEEDEEEDSEDEENGSTKPHSEDEETS